MLENYRDILTVKDLYDILPIGRAAIYKLIREGQIRSIRIGQKILVPKKALIEFIENMNGEEPQN